VEGKGMSDAPTPRTDAYIGDQGAVVLTAGEEAMCEFARTLEREQECMRSAFDKQCSVTLGQMQTIRELWSELAAANERAEKAEAEAASSRRAHDRALRAEVEVTEEGLDLLRAIAAKDAALMLFHDQAELDGFCWPKSKCMACRALSPGAGNGWLSPKEAEKLKVDIESWEQQASEHAKLAIQLGKERDAWLEDAEKLRGENLTLQINLDGSKGMSRLMREQRDAWREDAENLAQFIPVKDNPAGQAALAAHDALVAKEKGQQ
jgi:hypothetical protein